MQVQPRSELCKVYFLDELLELSGEDRDELTKFFETHLHYGAFFGLPRFLMR